MKLAIETPRSALDTERALRALARWRRDASDVVDFEDTCREFGVSEYLVDELLEALLDAARGSP